MTAHIIDGKAFASSLRAETERHVELFKQKTGRKPGLAVVLVGDDRASRIYVRAKSRATVATGMDSFKYRLSEDIAQYELLALVKRLNADPAVDGILVQLPLPSHLDENAVIAEIDPG